MLEFLGLRRPSKKKYILVFGIFIKYHAVRRRTVLKMKLNRIFRAMKESWRIKAVKDSLE